MFAWATTPGTRRCLHTLSWKSMALERCRHETHRSFYLLDIAITTVATGDVMCPWREQLFRTFSCMASCAGIICARLMIGAARCKRHGEPNVSLSGHPSVHIRYARNVRSFVCAKHESLPWSLHQILRGRVFWGNPATAETKRRIYFSQLLIRWHHDK